MKKALLGKKIGMSQVFTEAGAFIPVTIVKVEKNYVTQIRNVETDGYSAIQLAVHDKKKQRTNQAEVGHAKKANTTPKKTIREFRVNSDEIANYNLGQQIGVEIFTAGEFVDIQGTTKGKGFQGVIKRHNQSTGPNSHGSRYHRRPGSMGAVAPAVFKGKKLPGQMGGTTVTIQNLEIVEVNEEEGVLLIKGNIPGPKNSNVVIKNTIKNIETGEALELAVYEEAQPTIVEDTESTNENTDQVETSDAKTEEVEDEKVKSEDNVDSEPETNNKNEEEGK